MNRPSALLVTGAALLLIACGCASRQAAQQADAPFPRPFELELRAINDVEDRRVYYRLEPNGTLHFAGGLEAVSGDGEPAGTLTVPQRNKLWKLVRKHELWNADGQWLAGADHVRYEFEFQAGDRSNSITAVDDELPALAKLDRMLFRMQADMRYGDVLGPIEEKIERHGGAVEKK